MAPTELHQVQITLTANEMYDVRDATYNEGASMLRNKLPKPSTATDTVTVTLPTTVAVALADMVESDGQRHRSEGRTSMMRTYDATADKIRAQITT